MPNLLSTNVLLVTLKKIKLNEKQFYFSEISMYITMAAAGLKYQEKEVCKLVIIS